MKKIVFNVFFVLANQIVSGQVFVGDYRIENEKSNILSPISTITIKENNVIFLKAFFHTAGWRTYQGIWSLNKNMISITNLIDTAGTATIKKKLIVDSEFIKEMNDSIKIAVSDDANFTGVQPALITINDKAKVSLKSDTIVSVGFVPINKILVDLWGIKDSVSYKNPLRATSLKIKIIIDSLATTNYYYKDIIIQIRKGNLYLKDGSKLYSLKH